MILHIDMDAFFASVEQLDNPALKGKPVIVGGRSDRGVVAAASYEARKFGVRSAMPIFMARKKCPDGVFVPPRRKRYIELSKQIISIFTDYSPLVEQVSIDEAYIDVCGCERLFGDPESIAGEIKRRVRESVGLTCSVGIGPNKFIAKIASEMKKPDGLVMIRPEELPTFINELPIEKVPGVGNVTLQVLKTLNVNYLGDITKISSNILLKKFGRFGERLIQLSQGMDHSPVETCHERKSVSSEETFMKDTTDKSELRQIILRHSENVAEDLRKLDLKAGTVTLKIKHSDFKQITRSSTPAVPVISSDAIYKEAAGLLESYVLIKPVRLIGVAAGNLKPCYMPVQRDLFDSDSHENKDWESVDRAIDCIRARFGDKSLNRATIMRQRNGNNE